MDQTVKDEIARRLAAPPDPPLTATRDFLQSYCSDEGSLREIQAAVHRMASINTRTLKAGKVGLESLLAEPSLGPGVLLSLVATDANKALDDHTDAGARVWLNELLDILREELHDTA